jgi:hypothetical protein
MRVIFGWGGLTFDLFLEAVFDDERRNTHKKVGRHVLPCRIFRAQMAIHNKRLFF